MPPSTPSSPAASPTWPDPTLSVLDRALVELCSVARDSLSRATLAYALTDLGIRASAQRAHDAQSLRAPIRALAGRGMLVTRHGDYMASLGVSELAARALSAEGRFADLEQLVTPSYRRYMPLTLRSRLYRRDQAALFEAIDADVDGSARRALAEVLDSPYDPAFLRTYPPAPRAWLLASLVGRRLERVEPLNELANELAGLFPELPERDVVRLTPELFWAYSLSGQRDKARALAEDGFPELLGVLDLFAGDADGARAQLRSGIASLRRGKRRSYPQLDERTALLWVALCLVSARPEDHSDGIIHLRRFTKRAGHERAFVLEVMQRIADVRQSAEILGPQEAGERGLLMYHFPDGDDRHGGVFWRLVVGLLAFWWAPAALPEGTLAWLRAQGERARAAGWSIFAEQLEALAAAVRGEDPVGPTLVEAFRPTPPWRELLERLAALAPSGPADSPGQATAQGTERLAWVLAQHGSWVYLEPRLQVRQKTSWSKGRKVALQRLFGGIDPTIACATDADRAVAAHVRQIAEPRHYSIYNDISYAIDISAAAPALVGHPALVWEDARERPVEVVIERPRLRASIKGRKAHLALEPTPGGARRGPNDELFIARLEGPASRIAQALDESPPIPEAGWSDLRTILAQLRALVPVDVPEALAPPKSENRQAVDALIALFEESDGDDARPAPKPGRKPRRKTNT
jgi:hypothetical protein